MSPPLAVPASPEFGHAPGVPIFIAAMEPRLNPLASVSAGAAAIALGETIECIICTSLVFTMQISPSKRSKLPVGKAHEPRPHFGEIPQLIGHTPQSGA